MVQRTRGYRTYGVLGRMVEPFLRPLTRLGRPHTLSQLALHIAELDAEPP